MIDANGHDEAKKGPATAIKAIRAKCLDCSCGSANEVRNCELVHCPLYKFRLGKNPNITRVMSDEQKDAARARLAAAREARETA